MSYNPQNPNGQATSANSAPVVIASDQSAVPVSGTLGITANSSVNLAQVAGTTTDVNSGLKSAGTQRVILATDQPQLTNALKVDGSAVTQPVSGTVTVQQGTATNLKVDLSGTAANATALKVDGSAVTQPVSGTVGITANSSVNVAQINGVTTSMGNGVSGTGVQRVTLASDSTGQVALATGANTIGNVGINAGSNAIGSVNLAPTATGGWSVFSLASGLTSTTTVSGAAGKFGGYMFINLNSTPAYVQVFDTTGSPTLGSATFVIPIPANGTPANGVGANLEMTIGIGMASGIKVAATTTATGSGLVSTGIIGFILYK